MSTLKRTQIYFPEDILMELRKKANEENISIAKVIRSAVLELIKKEKKKNWIEDPLWNMVGSSISKDKNLSVNHDKYLYEKNQ